MKLKAKKDVPGADLAMEEKIKKGIDKDKPSDYNKEVAVDKRMGS